MREEAGKDSHAHITKGKTCVPNNAAKLAQNKNVRLPSSSHSHPLLAPPHHTNSHSLCTLQIRQHKYTLPRLYFANIASTGTVKSKYASSILARSTRGAKR